MPGSANDCPSSVDPQARGQDRPHSRMPHNVTTAFKRIGGQFRSTSPTKDRVGSNNSLNSEPTANSGDLFGKSSLRTSGFEPVCGQAWTTGEEGPQGEPSLKRSSSRGPGSSKMTPAKEPTRLARTCHWLLELKFVQIFMLVLTVAILFCGDLFQATLDVTYDSRYKVILWICLVCFSTEWCMQVLASAATTPPYVGSLFFYLDALATFSIAIDIFLLEANNLMENGPIARAARAARIGTRAGRSMRLLRLMRFLRLVRVTRFIKAFLQHRQDKKNQKRKPDDEFVPTSQARADTIGAQIGATTTKKVIIMTLILLVVLPLLEPNLAFHTCNAELVVTLESYFSSSRVQNNCTRMKSEVESWFDSELVRFSRHPDTGLTKRGLIFAQIKKCVLYSNDDLMGDYVPEQTTLARQRRGTEIQAIPCGSKMVDVNRDGDDERAETYLLYDMREEEMEAARLAMGFTTVVVVILLGFSLIFSQDAEVLANELVVPIGQLMNDMSLTSRLELDKVTPEEDLFESNVYEVRKLQASYLTLNAALGSFAKFTPLEVVRHFLSLGCEAQLGVEQRNVSIFFSDIAGFTTICEGTPPVEVLALLSEYFESMVSIIVEEKGTMLEFIGDAILAIWNAPNSVPDHAVRAITTSLRMNSVLGELRKRWSEQGKPHIRIRCGLHSADVFVGNLGSRMRMKYGVLGDGVNLASRLEELNKRYSTEVMISEDVLLQPDVKNLFYVRPIDNVVVKGRLKPTAVYEVLSLKEGASKQTKQVASQSQQAIEAYMGRDFDRALQCLDAVMRLKEGRDPAGEVLADRCRQFLEHPPGAEWDGSEVLKAKTFGKEE